MKKIILLLLLAFSIPAFAVDYTKQYNLPTQNSDGSTIPATGNLSLNQIVIERGTCSGIAFGTVQDTVTKVLPGTGPNHTFTGLAAGDYCFRARVRNVLGAVSGDSLVAKVTLLAPPVIPNPPLNVADNLTAYTVIKQTDRFIMLPVGTVPAGTQCNPNQQVNGYYVVPKALVTFSGNVQPEVVVAQCS